MAIAVVNNFYDVPTTSGNSRTIGPQSLTAGNLIYLHVYVQPTNLSVTSIVDTAGNTYVSTGSRSISYQDFRTETFYAVNCLGNASNSTTVTVNGQVTSFHVTSVQFSGVSNNTPIDVISTTVGVNSTSATSDDFTPFASGEYAFVHITAASATNTATPGTNYIQRDFSIQMQDYAEDRASAPAGSQNATTGAWTTASNYQMIVTVFSPTDIPVPTTIGPPLRIQGRGRTFRRPSNASLLFTQLTQLTQFGATLPDSITRRAWQPELTWRVDTPITGDTVIVPKSPIPPEAPGSFARPWWNPEKTERDLPAWTADTVIVPTNPVPPVAPDLYRRMPWSPERSDTRIVQAPSGILVIVPASPVPPVLPEGFLRMPWRPERTEADLVIVITAPPPPAPTVGYWLLPDSFMRWPWNPERTDARTVQAGSNVLVVVPASPVPPVAPERWARAAWQPERTDIRWGPYTNVIPASPVPPVEPSGFVRPWWNPNRTDIRPVLGPAGVVVVVPRSPIPPVQPEMQARPPWRPERTELHGVLGPDSVVVVVPRDPLPPVAPERYPPIWKPEKSDVRWGPFTQPPFVPVVWGFEHLGQSARLRYPWRPEKSTRETPVDQATLHPDQPIVYFMVPPGLRIHQPFQVTAVVVDPGLGPRLDVRGATARSFPRTMRHGPVFATNILGRSSVYMGQFPIFLGPGSLQVFYWTAVGDATREYKAGIYTALVGEYTLSLELQDVRGRVLTLASNQIVTLRAPHAKIESGAMTGGFGGAVKVDDPEGNE